MECIKNTKTTEEEQWLEVLAGKTTPPDDSLELTQARELRKLILAENKNAAEQISSQELSQGRERLLFRLQREGMLPKKGEDTPGQDSKRAVPTWTMALAASVILAVMLPVMLEQNEPRLLPDPQPTTNQSPVISKGFTMPEIVVSAQPGQDAASFAARVELLGFTVVQDAQEGSFIVIVILNGQGEKLESLLQEYSIPSPADSSSKLMVQFVARNP